MVYHMEYDWHDVKIRCINKALSATVISISNSKIDASINGKWIVGLLSWSVDYIQIMLFLCARINEG